MQKMHGCLINKTICLLFYNRYLCIPNFVGCIRHPAIKPIRIDQLMFSRACHLCALIALSLATSACVPAVSSRALITENDFYYIPPQATASVYTPGVDLD